MIPEVGRFVELACGWEATARKAGNVHPGACFSDLCHLDFLRSAQAIAPVMAEADEYPLGETILKAIRATRAVVSTNTNLGIVLLLAPLAKAFAEVRFDIALEKVLRSTTPEDTRNIYQAIREAVPGGMGKVDEGDIAEVPTISLLDAMNLAKDRDDIARMYSTGFDDLFTRWQDILSRAFDYFGNVEGAILELQLEMLGARQDSLIRRKCGGDIAEDVRQRALLVKYQGGLRGPEGCQEYRRFDDWLRGYGKERNPGTTADLITACLFIALRENRISETASFPLEQL